MYLGICIIFNLAVIIWYFLLRNFHYDGFPLSLDFYMRFFYHLISSKCLINILMFAICSGLAYGLWIQGFESLGSIT